MDIQALVIAMRELQERIVATRHQHGFETDWENFPVKVMLVVTEMAEAVEAHRRWLARSTVPSKQIQEDIAEELVDALIRILDIAHSLDLDFVTALCRKMDVNDRRPHLHGKRY